MTAIDDTFINLEERAGFFEIRIDGVPIWERIRHSVYREIKQELGIEASAHTNTGFDSTPRKYFHALKNLISGSLDKNPLLSSKRDILVYGHQRRKQLNDGLWWDIYFDPIYEELDLDYIHFEGQHENRHLTPAKTEDLRYRDFIFNLARLWRQTGLSNVDDEIQKITAIENEIKSEFSVDLDLTYRVRSILEIRRPLRRLYRAMLRRIDPEVVLLVVSYNRETFIESCKEMNIPVVELQHGVIHPQHLGYAYPRERRKETFPDYLFVWGDFWKEQVEFPIPDDRVLSVGYPYLERAMQQYTDVESRDQILFISQGTTGEPLSRFALEAHEHPDIDHDIVYKLHPGEYDRWKEEYPWLVDADFEVVDDSGELYQLFAESKVQVGVGSTAVYEGLTFDLETYICGFPGAEVLQPLIAENAAECVSSVEELAERLGAGTERFDRDRYFTPDATKRICDVLGELLRSDRSNGSDLSLASH